MAIDSMFFCPDRLFDCLHGGIEALHVADHERNACVPCSGDDLAALRHGRGDRLFDQNMHASFDAGKREILMEVSRGRNADGIDALREERADVSEGPASRSARHHVALLGIGVHDADQVHGGKIGEEHGRGCCP